MTYKIINFICEYSTFKETSKSFSEGSRSSLLESHQSLKESIFLSKAFYWYSEKCLTIILFFLVYKKKDLLGRKKCDGSARAEVGSIYKGRTAPRFSGVQCPLFVYRPNIRDTYDPTAIWNRLLIATVSFILSALHWVKLHFAEM